MEYEINFTVPDEVDALVNDIRRKWVAEKVTEFVRELIAHEAVNGLETAVLQIKPEIRRHDGEV